MKYFLPIAFVCLFIAWYSPKATIHYTDEPTPSLNHIALYVKNLPASTKFYMDILKLDSIPEPFHDGKHTWLSIGPSSALHLIEGRTNEPIPSKHTHICFAASNFNTIISSIRSSNISFEDWPGKQNAITKRPDGVQQIYLQDPDGYWIEINDAKK